MHASRPDTGVQRPDVLVLSLGTTGGLRMGDATFVALARAAGASVVAASTRIGIAGHLRRAYPVTDAVEAVAARRALHSALTRHDPRAVVLSSTTAALLAGRLDRPYAVRLDAPAALNRPGPANAPLHALERRRLARARLVLPWSAAAAAALPSEAAPAIVVPVPVLPSGGAGGAPPERREPLAVAYAPDPKARGLDLLVRAWVAADAGDARLEVFGISPDRARRHLDRHGLRTPAGIVWRGRTPAPAFRAALRRARAFVSAARWEDHGLAPLEALADGALLVTTAAGGPYAALPLARQLDPLLVAADRDPELLGAAIRRALHYRDDRAAAYRRAAAELVAPLRPEAVVATLRERVLPVLLGPDGVARAGRRQRGPAPAA